MQAPVSRGRSVVSWGGSGSRGEGSCGSRGEGGRRRGSPESRDRREKRAGGPRWEGARRSSEGMRSRGRSRARSRDRHGEWGKRRPPSCNSRVKASDEKYGWIAAGRKNRDLYRSD